MIAGAAFALSFSAFAALCLGMDGHHREVYGWAPSPVRARRLRAAGWLLLAASFALAVAASGAARGSVEWLGMLSASAVSLVLLLAYQPKKTARLAWAAAGIGALALTGTGYF